MSGLSYVGANYSADDNGDDLVSKLDVDESFADASVGRGAVQAAINTAAGDLASNVFVNNALAAYIQPNYITTQEANLIANDQIGATGALLPLDPAPQIAPLNEDGVIPQPFIPSLGAGYCLGPFGTTKTYSVSTGASPVKICDWNIGVQNLPFQPLVFMSVLAGALKGGRPVIEVWLSTGATTYNSSGSVLVARGKGRNCWNDLQALIVKPTPASAGQAGIGGAGYPGNYNIWLSAWLYDANAQSVSVNSNNIISAGVFLFRNRA